MRRGGPRPLDWTIVFEDDAVRAEARVVEAAIRRGGCDATDVLWTETIRRDDLDGMRPPALAPGTWGFAARARDASCRWIAEGCTEVQLGPGAGPTHVETALAAIALEPACPPDQCRDGECGVGDVDAGTMDAGTADAAVSDAGEVDASGSPDTGVRDAGPDAGSGCTAADERCDGDDLITCDTGTGLLDRDTCELGCVASEVRCADFVPSNIAPSFIDRGAPAETSTAGGTIDTTTCSTSPAFGTPSIVASGTSGWSYCVIQVDTLVLDGDWRVTGDWPLVIAADGDVEIMGTIDLSARGNEPGPGGFAGGTASARSGLAPLGGSGGGGGGHVNSFEDGGGGGGGLCGAGGSGGAGVTAPGGASGASVGSWDLEPIAGGSGGGAGNGGSTSLGPGGGGGGALQISSRVSITVTANIYAGGGGGQAGLFGGGNAGAAGGGGSGGAILLEAPVVDITGARLAASGGGGGSGSDFGTSADGVDGNDALGRAGSPVPGGTAVGSSGAGGTGAAAGGLDGADGADGNNNGGGGGGGAGCILIRNADGTTPRRRERAQPLGLPRPPHPSRPQGLTDDPRSVTAAVT